MAGVKPVRLQLSRAKGFNLQAHSCATNGLPAVYCARPFAFGNPFRVRKPVDLAQMQRWDWCFAQPHIVCVDNAEAARRFAMCLFLDETAHGWVRRQLRGKNCACFCALDEPCHVDPLLELANR